jgi:hypothetical protein
MKRKSYGPIILVIFLLSLALGSLPALAASPQYGGV